MTQEKGIPYQRHKPSAALREFLDPLDPGAYFDCGRARLHGLDDALLREAESRGRQIGDDTFQLVATDMGLIFCRPSISFAIAARWEEVMLIRPNGEDPVVLPVTWPTHGELKFTVSKRLAGNIFRRWLQLRIQASRLAKNEAAERFPTPGPKRPAEDWEVVDKVDRPAEEPSPPAESKKRRRKTDGPDAASGAPAPPAHAAPARSRTAARSESPERAETTPRSHAPERADPVAGPDSSGRSKGHRRAARNGRSRRSGSGSMATRTPPPPEAVVTTGEPPVGNPTPEPVEGGVGLDLPAPTSSSPPPPPPPPTTSSSPPPPPPPPAVAEPVETTAESSLLPELDSRDRPADDPEIVEAVDMVSAVDASEASRAPVQTGGQAEGKVAGEPGASESGSADSTSDARVPAVEVDTPVVRPEVRGSAIEVPSVDDVQPVEGPAEIPKTGPAAKDEIRKPTVRLESDAPDPSASRIEAPATVAMVDLDSGGDAGKRASSFDWPTAEEEAAATIVLPGGDMVRDIDASGERPRILSDDSPASGRSHNVIIDLRDEKPPILPPPTESSPDARKRGPFSVGPEPQITPPSWIGSPLSLVAAVVAVSTLVLLATSAVAVSRRGAATTEVDAPASPRLIDPTGAGDGGSVGRTTIDHQRFKPGPTTSGAIRSVAITPDANVSASTTTTIVEQPVDDAVFRTRPRLCNSNYSGCVADVSDVDCPGDGDGPVFSEEPAIVMGQDVYELDTDGDGQTCEADQPKRSTVANDPLLESVPAIDDVEG